MSSPFERLGEITDVLPANRWMLVGGLMVHAHAELAGFTHPRPTDDVDMVVELRAGSYLEAAASLESIGYRRHEPLDLWAPFHRFLRGQEIVDLMVPDDRPVRSGGRDVVAVPGARSALKRVVPHVTPGGVVVRIPDLESALSLKGAAYRLPGADRDRHLQDGITLFGCPTGTLRLSGSMRRNVNYLINALGAVTAWADSPPAVRRRAIRAIRGVRPDWVAPEFVLPSRPRPRR